MPVCLLACLAACLSVRTWIRSFSLPESCEETPVMNQLIAVSKPFFIWVDDPLQTSEHKDTRTQRHRHTHARTHARTHAQIQTYKRFKRTLFVGAIYSSLISFCCFPVQCFKRNAQCLKGRMFFQAMDRKTTNPDKPFNFPPHFSSFLTV